MGDPDPDALYDQVALRDLAFFVPSEDGGRKWSRHERERRRGIRDGELGRSARRIGVGIGICAWIERWVRTGREQSEQNR